MSNEQINVGVLDHYIENRVGYIVFNNQSKFNAVNYEMWCALPKIIDQFVSDDEVRLIVITGAGEKAFISGADISQFASKRTGDAAAEYNKATDAGYLAVVNCPKPTIAKIKGVCMGGGLGLALNCDIRICADNAKFRMPAARLGLGYSMDGLKRFVEIVGTANTADLFFSARIFDGQEAQRIGLVKQVIGIDTFEEVFNQYIELVAINAPITIAAAKQTLIELRKAASEQDAELIKSMVTACFASEDYQEGRKAFMEKRIPNFQGK